jgi:hypothetical protein
VSQGSVKGEFCTAQKFAGQALNSQLTKPINHFFTRRRDDPVASLGVAAARDLLIDPKAIAGGGGKFFGSKLSKLTCG